MNGFSRHLRLGLAVCAACHVASAGLMNGDFSSGLTGWTVGGDVVASGGQAVFGDTTAQHSALYQIVEWPSPDLRIDFEFLNLLSEVVYPGGFLDALFASVYFVNDPASFDLGQNQYDSVVSLFDLDVHGVYNSGGVVTPGSRGGDWLHFSAVLPRNEYAYAIPVFELYDLNGGSSDSLVLLDDVSLVPEPASSALFCLGGILLLLRKTLCELFFSAGRF